MTKMSPRAQSRGSVFASASNVVLAWILAVQRAIEGSLAAYREEAMLRSLDKRLLEDIGFEPYVITKIKPDHASKSTFAPLWEPFSWTRFGK